MEYTISGYLLGFSLGHLFWGPVSDTYGRKVPMAIGLVLFILGSAGCALSINAHMMIGFRILQASGASAGVVLARAMVRDLYDGPRAAQMLSTLITVMAIAPLIGPFAGAKMLTVAGWPAIFWVLVPVGAITLLSLATIPETLPKERRSLMPLGIAFRGYARLLSRPKLMAYAAAGAFFYAGAFTYIAGTPFAFITYYGVSEIAYSFLFALSVGAVMLTNTLNARLVARLGVDRLLLVGSLILAVAGLVLAFDALTGFGGLLGPVLPLFVYMGLNGLIVANSMHQLVRRYGPDAVPEIWAVPCRSI